MNNKVSKKPSLDEFEDAIKSTAGNISDAAVLLHVTRQTVHNWLKEDEDFKSIVDDSRKKMFDRCLDTARLLALGVPKVKDGKFCGWVERPDSGILRYMLQTLGKDEGFGNSLDLTSGGQSLPQIINLIESDSVDE